MRILFGTDDSQSLPHMKSTTDSFPSIPIPRIPNYAKYGNKFLEIFIIFI
jgi:hypothetical protein